MKNILYIFLSISILWSCKKSDVASLSGRAAGTYTINTTKLNKQAVAGLTGTIKISTLAADKVKIKVTYTLDKQSDFFDINELSLVADGDDIDLKQGSDLVGTVSGKNLLFFLSGDDGTIEFQASK